MRDEAYSTWLSAEYASLQREIDHSIVAIGGSGASGAGRRAQSVQAIRRIDAMIGDLEKKNAAFYKDDYTKIFRGGYSSKSLDMASVYGRDMGPIGPISSTDRSFLSRERARGLKNSRDALSQTRQRFAADVLKADPKMAKVVARDGHKMVASHGRMYGIGSYGDLVTNSAASRAWNRGSLEAVKRVVGDTGNVVISDGPDCGLRSHRDPETANGMVIPASEASAYLSAHPNCQRAFFPEPKPSDGKGVRDRLEALTKAAKLTGVAAAATGAALAYGNRLAVVSALNRHMLKNMPDWERFDLQIRALQRQLQSAPVPKTGGNVTDIRSLRPLDNSSMGIARRVYDDAMNYMRGVDIQMSDEARRVIGIASSDDRMTTTAKIAKYDDFFTANRKANMSDRLLTNFDAAEQAIRKEFAQMVVGGDEALASIAGDIGRTGANYGAKTRMKILNSPADLFFRKIQGVLPDTGTTRLTLPRIRNAREQGGGLARAIRGRLDLGQWVRFTGTGKIRGKNVGSLLVNRNGMLRAGLQYTNDGMIIPRLNFVPKFSPIRISSRVNRGVAGNINSVSGQLRVLVPGPFTPSVNFNFDLRALNISDLFDVRNVRMADLKKLSLDNLRLRSLALESQWRMMGRMDIHNVWRIKWEDLNYLLRKTDDDVFMTGDRSFTFYRRYQTEKLRLLGVDYFKNPKLARENFRKNFGDDVKGVLQREVDQAIKQAQDFQEAIKGIASVLADRERFLVPLRKYTADQILEVRSFLSGIREVERAGLEAGDGFVSRWLSAVKAGGDTAWQKFLVGISSSDSEVLAHVLSVHKRYFIDMPAKKRRDLMRIVPDGELQAILNKERWSSTLKIWSMDIQVLADKFGISSHNARTMKRLVSDKVRDVHLTMKGLTNEFGREEVVWMIKNHFSNAKMKIRSIRSWEDFFALGDDAVEAFGRFGEWMTRQFGTPDPDFDYANIRDALKVPAPPKVVRPSTSTLKNEFYFGDYDAREVSLKAARISYKDPSKILKNSQESVQLLKHYVKKFDLENIVVRDGTGLLPQGVDGTFLGSTGFDPSEMLLTYSRLNGRVRDLEIQFQSSWWAQHDAKFRPLSTMAHELGHAVDHSKKLTGKHSGELVDLIMGNLRSMGVKMPTDARLAEVGGFDWKNHSNITPKLPTIFRTGKTDADYLRLYVLLRDNKKILERVLSGYSSTLPEEFIAEIMRTGVLSANPSKLSRDIMKFAEGLPRSS